MDLSTALLAGLVPCPRCKSTMTYVNIDGDLECITCGNIKTTLPPTTSREPHKRRRIKDETRGQGLTGAVALRIRKAMGL